LLKVCGLIFCTPCYEEVEGITSPDEEVIAHIVVQEALDARQGIANDEVDEKGPKAADKNDPNPEAEQHPFVDQRAFFEAVKSGDIETVKLALLQDHLDVNAKSEVSQMTALIHACINGRESIVKLLLERKDLSVVPSDYTKCPNSTNILRNA
jgi:hypothetical protein